MRTGDSNIYDSNNTISNDFFNKIKTILNSLILTERRYLIITIITNHLFN